MEGSFEKGRGNFDFAVEDEAGVGVAMVPVRRREAELDTPSAGGGCDGPAVECGVSGCGGV